MTRGSFFTTYAGLMTLCSFLGTSAGLMTGHSLLGTLSRQENCLSSTLRVSRGDLLGVGFEVISHSTFLGVC